MDAMTSRQKVLAVLSQLDDVEPDGVDPQMQAALFAATMARPQIMGMLPDDPEVLDDWLLLGSNFFLSLRSDTAAPYAVTDGEGRTIGELQAAAAEGGE